MPSLSSTYVHCALETWRRAQQNAAAYNVVLTNVEFCTRHRRHVTAPTNSPVNHSPVNHSPVHHAPVNHSPANHSPVNHSPVNHSPVNQSPVNHAPVNHAPVNHAPVNHSPVNHSPLQSLTSTITHLYNLIDVVFCRVSQQKFSNVHRNCLPLASILRYGVHQ